MVVALSNLVISLCVKELEDAARDLFLTYSGFSFLSAKKVLALSLMLVSKPRHSREWV